MKIRLHLLTSVLVSSMILSACERKKAKDAKPSEAKTGPSQSQDEKAYRLKEGDTIAMQIENEPKLDTLAEVDKTGVVSFPLIGEVDVEGISVSELEQRLWKIYRKDLYVDPKISITLESKHMPEK